MSNNFPETIDACLSKKEKRFRKWFQRYLIIDTFFRFFVITANYWNHTLAQLWHLSFLFLGFYILYHCAYKKYGTAYLTFTMVVYPIVILKDLWGIISDFDSDPGFYFWLLFFALIIYGTFYFFSFRIRKINHKIQTFEFTSSDYFQKNIALLRESKDEAELACNYGEIFKQCPSRFSGALTLIYNEIKQDFVDTK
ncbi:MAG: hypothetical protein WAM28_06320 [Chlamydiales bacterium]